MPRPGLIKCSQKNSFEGGVGTCSGHFEWRVTVAWPRDARGCDKRRPEHVQLPTLG